MRLLLVRHAIAEVRDPDRWPDDARRPLTERGRQRFVIVAEHLRALALPVDHILASSFDRAWETAEILALAIDGPSPIRCFELEFAPADEILLALDPLDPAAVVVLVGHEPTLSELTSLLLTGSEDRFDVAFKKGAALLVETASRPAPGVATLLWYLTPRLAHAMRLT